MRVEFLFDFGSPNAYLCHRVIPQIEARTGVKFTYVPILLGGLFKATGNQSPVMAYAGIPKKLAYQRLEMQRFIQRHEITDFTMNPFFPVNTLMVMRGAVAAQTLGIFEDYVEAVYRFMWADPRKMDDPDVLAAALTEAGFDAGGLFEAAQSPEVKQQLVDNTAKAAERGAFGSPTFFVGDEMWFGKERLEDVERAILSGV